MEEERFATLPSEARTAGKATGWSSDVWTH